MTDAPIDFEEFASAALAPWFSLGAEQPSPAAECSDPKMAAARGLHLAWSSMPASAASSASSPVTAAKEVDVPAIAGRIRRQQGDSETELMGATC